jgi:hypothetical protein
MRITCALTNHQHSDARVSDEFTVPLCRGHHREFHRCGDETNWWKKTSIDPTAVASMLWLKTHPLSEVIGRQDVKLFYGPEAKCIGATLTSPRAESNRQID